VVAASYALKGHILAEQGDLAGAREAISKRWTTPAMMKS
jgi:hypothetical protein